MSVPIVAIWHLHDRVEEVLWGNVVGVAAIEARCTASGERRVCVVGAWLLRCRQRLLSALLGI